MVFKKLISLFSKPELPRVQYHHEMLGLMHYNADEKLWETIENPVYHGGIKGDEQGPVEDDIRFILQKLDSIDVYWKECSEDLEEIAHGFGSIPSTLSARELYKVSALSLYGDLWEICFDTLDQYKWISVCMQFDGEEYITNDITT